MIFLTGSTGFVGNSIIKYFGKENIISYQRGLDINLSEARVIIHLAGKANDRLYTPSEFYQVNTELTKIIYNKFLSSSANIFIYFSSVKAVAEEFIGEMTENHYPNPVTHYGKSKLFAEQYILSCNVPQGKRVFILRPSIIHGPGNRGNLNLLYKIVSKNFVWPFGLYDNKRSFCGIDNLMFILKELIEREDIPSGIYNIADDEAVSANELINLIAELQNKKPIIWNIPKGLIESIAKVGNTLFLPFNSILLKKVTSAYVVSNSKIKKKLNKPLPHSSLESLEKTFKSFNNL
jgi:nucleoside-diphosphate-sugar epimerase